jgi:hypothetical protein
MTNAKPGERAARAYDTCEAAPEPSPDGLRSGQESRVAAQPPEVRAPTSFHSVVKLNPGLEPFIFFGL